MKESNYRFILVLGLNIAPRTLELTSYLPASPYVLPVIQNACTEHLLGWQTSGTGETTMTQTDLAPALRGSTRVLKGSCVTVLVLEPLVT